MCIEINFQADKIEDIHPFETLIRQAVETTLKIEDFNEPCEVSIRIVDKKNIQTLNKQYRNKDVPTDVLSFTQYDEDGFETFEDEPVFIGDIVLCIDIAKEQAARLGHTLDREIAYLSCHSTLHLLGYDHECETDKQEMRAREKRIMDAMHLAIKLED